MSVLDKFLKVKRTELSELKQKRRKLKEASAKAKLDGPISDLDLLIRRFMKSRMDPRRVGEIVINYKLFSQYLKKLKGFDVEVIPLEKSIRLNYKKGSAGPSGKLELFDLSPFFEGYVDVSEFPPVEIEP